MSSTLQFREHDSPTDVEPVVQSSARVLHIINGEHYAGAERVQDLLGLRLSEFGYEVGFACMKSGQFPALRQSVRQPLYEVPMRGRWDLRPAFAIARLVRREGFGLIHTHTARSAVIGRIAASLAGVPMVHHVHSPAAADTTHRWRNRINVAGEHITLRGAAALIAVSEAMAAYARTRRIPEHKLTVVHNGVPTAGPLLSRATPAESWTLGTIALLRPRKGLEVLIEALAALRAQGARVRLRVVGKFETSDYERTIHERAETLGVADLIEWRGFTRQINAELAAMDLFALPSLFGEGLPMVVLEAMAAGVPVVATRVSGTPEAVRDQVDGLLAEPGDATSLAAAIGRFIAGSVDWQTIRSNAHARQTEQFSDYSMAAGVASVYRRVLSRTTAEHK
jgi:glycosyltransferase involved in cell wall biosynthesis